MEQLIIDIYLSVGILGNAVGIFLVARGNRKMSRYFYQHVAGGMVFPPMNERVANIENQIIVLPVIQSDLNRHEERITALEAHHA